MQLYQMLNRAEKLDMYLEVRLLLTDRFLYKYVIFIIQMKKFMQIYQKLNRAEKVDINLCVRLLLTDRF